jgi:hypothetical protein
MRYINGMNPYEAPQSINAPPQLVKEQAPEVSRQRGLGFYLALGILVMAGVLICIALLSPIFYSTLQFQRQQELKERQRQESERLQAEYQRQAAEEELAKRRQRNLLLLPPGIE